MKSKWALYALSLLLFYGQGIGEQIEVPAEQSTISAAITAASTGDTINVAAGTYYEYLNINESVLIRGNNSDDTRVMGAHYYEPDSCFLNSDIYSVHHPNSSNPDQGVWVDNTFYAFAVDSTTMDGADNTVWFSADTDSLYLHFSAAFDSCYAPLVQYYSIKMDADAITLRNLYLAYTSDYNILCLTSDEIGGATHNYIDSCIIEYNGLQYGYGYLVGDDTLTISNTTIEDMLASSGSSYGGWRCTGNLNLDNCTVGAALGALASIQLDGPGTYDFSGTTFNPGNSKEAVYAGGGACELTVDDCTFNVPTGTAYQAIKMISTNTGHLIVTNSTINVAGTADGIISANTASAYDVTITGNTFTHTGAFNAGSRGLELKGNYTGGEIADNTFNGTWGAPLFVGEFHDGTIHGNTYTSDGNEDNGLHGFHIGGEEDNTPAYFSYNVDFYNNTVSGFDSTGWGIILEYSADTCRIFNNYLIDCDEAIYILHDCNDNQVYNNHIVDSDIGIRIPDEDAIDGYTHADSCYDNTAFANTFINCDSSDSNPDYWLAGSIYGSNDLNDDTDVTSRNWRHYWGGDTLGQARLTLPHNWITRGVLQHSQLPSVPYTFATITMAGDSLTSLAAWDATDTIRVVEWPDYVPDAHDLELYNDAPQPGNHWKGGLN